MARHNDVWNQTCKSPRSKSGGLTRVLYFTVIMQLYDSLRPWVVYCRLPNFQYIVVARFQRRADAEQYLATLQYLIPKNPFLMTFDTENTTMVTEPRRRRLRHYLVGSPTDTQRAIDRLHLLGYVERIAWSQTVPLSERGLVIYPEPGDVLRYTQREFISQAQIFDIKNNI